MHLQDSSRGEIRPPSSPDLSPLDLPDEQAAILRQDLFGGLAGALGDLKTPEMLRNPVATAVEAAIFARLLEALDGAEIALPDEEARRRIERLAESFDRTSDYGPITATHDAHRALLDVLGGPSDDRRSVR